MKLFKTISKLAGLGLFVGVVLTSCQKMDKPALGDYPKDANPPGGPLKFYLAFDGTDTAATGKSRNAVDSIRANFPAENPFITNGVEGVRGAGITSGGSHKYIKFSSFNGWEASSSMTISVWFKQDGQTKNNNGTNGPNHFFSLKAQDNYHWSNSVCMFFIEGNNTGLAVKSIFVSPSDPTNPDSSPADSWFTWEGGNTIPGLCNNQWHHLAMVYDETGSSMTLYVDGVQNPNVGHWTGHGALRLAKTKVSDYRVGAGPSTGYDTDDWLAANLKGSMDQLRLYGTALTASEVQALFAAKQ
jgi:hypothetical protein